jgi:phenylalanyl-tRNA synthetase beta chain
VLFSLSWLKEYVELPELSVLSERLTRAGSEVEAVIEQEIDVQGVVVAKVVELRPHPNADKLQLARVSTGREQLEVVTGATNLKLGVLVPLATKGARLKDRKIESQVLRGIRSEGMLCSANELGLGQDADGILILDRGATPGEDLHNLFPSDTVLDVEIKSNRPDLLCHLGLARELSALFQAPLRPPAQTHAPTRAQARGDLVTLEAAQACRRFMACSLRDVRVASSPAWMQARLRACGVRPISNVVDITNYVMLEVGQPMHAFDRNRLAGSRLMVRVAHEGERLACLDGKTRVLVRRDIVVADNDHAQALAGLIGGTESAVQAETTDVILEAATWEPRRVRASSRRLGLRTDASTRFEKGLSPALGPLAIERASALIAELAGGEPVELTDLYAQRLVPVEIDLPTPRIERVLGVAIPVAEAAVILERLDFKVQVGEESLKATPPEFRLDCVIPEDLVEEIGRIYGYDRIPSTLPGRRTEVRDLYRRHDADERAREVMAGAGFDEAVSNSLVSSASAVEPRLPDAPGRVLRLQNPMAENRDALRASLLPGLLEALSLNDRQDQASARLFELGSVFWANGENVEEPRVLGIAVHVPGGADAALAVMREVQQTLKLVRERLAFSTIDFEASTGAAFHPGRTATILAQGAGVGIVGEVHPKLVSELGLSGRAVAAEILFEPFIQAATADPQAQPLPRFPGIRRDLTVVVRARLSAAELVQVIRRLGGYTLREISMLNEYRGAQLGKDARSLSFRLHYQADDRTLTNEEVASSHQRILEGLKQINAEVRS